MDRVHVIRHKVMVEGLSVRQVSREMGVSRNTVRKYLEESEPVRRAESEPRGRPVYEEVAGRLEGLVQEWSKRTTRKQRITARRVHRELVGEGYRVGLTLVQEWCERSGGWERRFTCRSFTVLGMKRKSTSSR